MKQAKNKVKVNLRENQYYSFRTTPWLLQFACDEVIFDNCSHSVMTQQKKILSIIKKRVSNRFRPIKPCLARCIVKHMNKFRIWDRTSEEESQLGRMSGACKCVVQFKSIIPKESNACMLIDHSPLPYILHIHLGLGVLQFQVSNLNVDTHLLRLLG